MAVLKIDPGEALDRLRQHGREGKDLVDRGGLIDADADFTTWKKDRDRWVSLTVEVLRSIYQGDEETEEFRRSISPRTARVVSMQSESTGAIVLRSAKRLEAGINTLQSLEERLSYAEVPPQLTARPSGRQTSVDTGGPIFVVHGHSESLMHQVVRMIERSTGRDAIILREQANSGRTLLEKFEDHAESASYAVVLLTADDFGKAATDDGWHARARQNVVFELGFFFGQLGRQRVAVLYDADVELPSDLNGLVYIENDGAGAWKKALAKELASAGIGIDHSRIP
jgi:predicted nucleotide-binding protein